MNKELFIVPFEPFEKHPGVEGVEVQARVDVYKQALLAHPHTSLALKDLECILPLSDDALEAYIRDIHLVDQFSPPVLPKLYVPLWERKDVTIVNKTEGGQCLVAFKTDHSNDEDAIYYAYHGSSNAVRAGVQYTLYLVHRALATCSSKHLLAFIPARPPNHHALCHLTFNSGFCGGVNLPMIALSRALHLLSSVETDSAIIPTILLIDFDFHEGNGTKDILRNKSKSFLNKARVVMIDEFCRTEYPFDKEECKLPRWEKYDADNLSIRNYGVQKIADETMEALSKEVVHFIETLSNLKMILVSAGWDGRLGDPVNRGKGVCSPHAYGQVMHEIQKAKVPVLLFQEGGYLDNNAISSSSQSLIDCVESCVNGFMNNERPSSNTSPSRPVTGGLCLPASKKKEKRKHSDVSSDDDTETEVKQQQKEEDLVSNPQGYFNSMYIMANWPGLEGKDAMTGEKVRQKAKGVRAWFVILVGPLFRTMLYHNHVFELNREEHRTKITMDSPRTKQATRKQDEKTRTSFMDVSEDMLTNVPEWKMDKITGSVYCTNIVPLKQHIWQSDVEVFNNELHALVELKKIQKKVNTTVSCSEQVKFWISKLCDSRFEIEGLPDILQRQQQQN